LYSYADGVLLATVTHPETNQTTYEYNSASPDPRPNLRATADVAREIRTPDTGRRGALFSDRVGRRHRPMADLHSPASVPAF
jgi:hypothetical protein